MSCKMINYVEWPAESGIIAQLCCDTSAELPNVNDFSTFGTLVATSTCRAIDESVTYQLNTHGVWKKKTDATSVALDLTDYYTQAEIDALIANRYSLAIVTGSGIPNGTNLDNWTQIGRFQNSNASNGCTNTPENRTNPFWLINERTYTTGRVKQTYYMGQSSNFHIFYWRVQYNNNLDWSSWAKFEGVIV